MRLLKVGGNLEEWVLLLIMLAVNYLTHLFPDGIWDRHCRFTDTDHFNIGSVMERGIKTIGCGQSPVQKYWKDILPWVETGDVDPTKILSHRFTMNDVAKSYKVLEKRQEGLAKCFIETKHSFPGAQGTPKLIRL